MKFSIIHIFLYATQSTRLLKMKISHNCIKEKTYNPNNIIITIFILRKKIDSDNKTLDTFKIRQYDTTIFSQKIKKNV